MKTSLATVDGAKEIADAIDSSGEPRNPLVDNFISGPSVNKDRTIAQAVDLRYRRESYAHEYFQSKIFTTEPHYVLTQCRMESDGEQCARYCPSGQRS